MKTIIQISTYNDLLDFIQRDNINSKQAIELISKSIGVFAYVQDEKIEIIRQLKKYWITFGKLPINKRPIFLNFTE